MSMGATRGPTWAWRGLPTWAVLVWLPVCYSLLIAPVADTADGRPWGAWTAAVLAAAAFTGAVATRFRPGPRQQAVALWLLGALGALAVVTVAAYSPSWASVFVLLAIGVGVVMGAGQAPYVVLLLSAIATVAVLLAGDTADSAFSTCITVLMSGLGTYAFHQLFRVVAELNRTRDELARAAVSEERERFARDLHDLLGHTMSVIVVKAEAVRRLAVRDSAAAANHAADIESIGREALTDIRRAASGYRGAGLERELVRAHSALDAAGVALSVEQRSVADPLSERADVLLGWVVREAVTNIVRHARATQCTITVERTAESVSLDIVDNGRGGDDGEQSPPGEGIRGLEDRVAATGGTLDARHTGRGFRLVVDVPSHAEMTSR